MGGKERGRKGEEGQREEKAGEKGREGRKGGGRGEKEGGDRGNRGGVTCTDVMEPFFVVVILSCMVPMSVASVGW